MTKDVIVSISGLQMPAEGEAEPVEVITVEIGRASCRERV